MSTGRCTLTPACTFCACNVDAVYDDTLGAYKKSWMDAFLAGAADMATIIKTTECAFCSLVEVR